MNMRRADREVREPERIEGILSECQVCRVGFQDGPETYIVPMSFGWQKRDGGYVLYFHGASEGRKRELIRSGPQVGFEMDCGYALKPAAMACGFTAAFRSIIGSGRMEEVTDLQEKQAGLSCLMAHYSGRADWQYPPEMLARLCVFRLQVQELSCKEHL